ncbi:MAG TPA: putative lipid II flippase FtsW [Streptosporangiaceae bacterium]|nr:putative lipid II flippase FtsW [Streptosporangiaceae bacterium]
MDVLAGVRGLFDRPLASYYLVVGISVLLLALGLVMVLSASSVQMLSQGDSPFLEFQKQMFGVALGLPLMWAASRLPPTAFRVIAYPLMGLSAVGLVLAVIPGVGVETNGAARWIAVGGLQLQPSEFAKLAFVLWGADLLARHERHGQLTEWRQLLVPLMPGAGILGVLVMIGNDLGTTLLLLTIFLSLLWVIGTPGRLFIGMLAFVCLVIGILIIAAPYRLERITSFVDPQAHAATSGWQPLQGKYALASGGWFGVGLGASRQKWGMLPNPSSDFIFAVLGEELGLAGTLCVMGLFGGLGYAGLRIARRVSDPFMRLAATAITAWIVVQALVNIGAVIGVLPITGVPLPLVSAGVSSLIVTMTAVGMLMAFAKREPGAAEALAARGPGAARRTLSWLGLGRVRE